MADKTVGIKVEVETSGAVKSLGDLESAVKETEQEVKKLGSNTSLADRLKELNNTVKDSPVNIRAMNKQIQEYQAIALQAGRTSPIGKAALQEAANLKDRYNDINAEVNRLANDGIKMQAALDLGTSVMGGYTAFQGALALTGVESEELQETLVKLQGAQSVLMGVETIRKNLEKESTLVIMAKNTAEKISTFIKGESAAASGALATAETARGAATVGATTATSAATVGMKLFRLALIATGIGAIVVGLGLLIANFDKVTKAVKGAVNYIMDLSTSFQNLGTSAKVLIGFLTFGIAPAISFLIEKAKELGIVETKEAKEQRQRAEDAVKQKQREVKIKIDLINKEIEANKKLTEELTNAIDFEIRKRSAAGEDIAGLEEDKIKMLIESARIEIQLINDKIAAKQKELEVSKGIMSGLVTGTIEGYKMQQDAQKDSIKLMLQDLEIFHIEQRKAKEDAAKKDAKQEDRIIKERAERRKHQSIEDILLIKEEKNAYLDYMALIQRTAQEQQEAKDKAREKELEGIMLDLERAEKFNQSLLDLNSAVLDAQLAGAEGNEAKQEEIRKKSFARNKALQMTMATINGIQAVLSTYAGTVGGPIIKGIAAGIAGATALANITKIARTQFQGSSGGGGSAPSSLGNTGRGANGANVGQVTNTTTTIGEPTKVYVTEQDISNTQNKVSVNEAQATI